MSKSYIGMRLKAERQQKIIEEQRKRIEELERELKQFYFKAPMATFQAVQSALKGEK